MKKSIFLSQIDNDFLLKLRTLFKEHNLKLKDYLL